MAGTQYRPPDRHRRTGVRSSNLGAGRPTRSPVGSVEGDVYSMITPLALIGADHVSIYSRTASLTSAPRALQRKFVNLARLHCTGANGQQRSCSRQSELSLRNPPGSHAHRPRRCAAIKELKSDMTTKSRLYLGAAALAIAVVLTGSVVEVSAQQSAPPVVAIDNDDIGGVVTGATGPEAGVWVIAETTDLPTRYAKIVVTDDQGRYVVPDLPKAKYKVWVRGYGLVDSPKVTASPARSLNLTAVPAPNEAAAAKYYPAIYWYSMIKIPDASAVRRQGTTFRQRHQAERLAQPASRTTAASAAISSATRRRARSRSARQVRRIGYEAWTRRIQSGQAGEPWSTSSPASSARTRR